VRATPLEKANTRISESDAELARSLEHARAQHLPVFNDFGTVQERLAMDSTIFSQFGLIGLPTYVVLLPEK